MMRRLAVIIPLLMFLGFVAVALYGLETPSDRPIESRLVGQPVPEFDLPGLDDAHPGLATSDLRQGTVTLVNLFGSWCLPCKLEAPQLEALAEDGVVIHAIAIRDEPAAVQRFLEQHGDPFRRIGLDPDGRMQIELGSSGVPETFLIDGDGIVRRQWIGELREDQLADVRRELARWQ
ncbi:MAG: DsbE family thiol:disulfide interchange protein [Pacificimonas sp.]